MSRGIKWISLSIVLSPVFISIPGFRILPLRALQPATSASYLDNAVSLLALFIAALGIPLIPSLVRAVSRRDPVCIAGLALAAYVYALGAAGALKISDPYPLLGATQYALPVAAVIIGYLFRHRHIIAWPRLLMVFIALNLGLPFLVFLWLYSSAGNGSTFRALSMTNRYFYALYSHIPALILLAALFLIGWLSRRNTVPVILLSATSMAAVFYTTWSRAAILTALLALAVLSALLARELFSHHDALLKAQLATCGAMLVAGLALPPLGMIGARGATQVRALEPVGEMVEPAARPQAGRQTSTDAAGAAAESSSPDDGATPSAAGDEEEPQGIYTDTLELSTDSRLAYMQVGLRKWYESPLFGIMFVPENVVVIHRRVVEKQQIFQSHNQYLDILLKTGAVGLLLFAVFYVWVVLRPLIQASLAATRSEQKVVYYASLAILAGVAVGANFQLYVTVWTTGAPLGFVMGYMLANARLEPER
jgi:hypothetical protein